MASILSHNGKLTIKNLETGNHRTFQIKTREFPDGSKKRVISMLIGSDNTSDYLPFGFVGRDGVYVWKKHQNDFYNKIAKLLPKVMEKENLEVHFETKCRVCNRTLTTIESIQSGVGPKCGGRV